MDTCQIDVVLIWKNSRQRHPRHCGKIGRRGRSGRRIPTRSRCFAFRKCSGTTHIDDTQFHFWIDFSGKRIMMTFRHHGLFSLVHDVVLGNMTFFDLFKTDVSTAWRPPKTTITIHFFLCNEISQTIGFPIAPGTRCHLNSRGGRCTSQCNCNNVDFIFLNKRNTRAIWREARINGTTGNTRGCLVKDTS